MAQARPVIFGEVLFDCFPDGQSVLGGAPFNVAWHLQSLSCAPLLVSSIGDDSYGKIVSSTMLAQGMDTSALQISERYPTGQVSVTLEQGQPSYEIMVEQAYDHIDAQAALDALPTETPALIYHGSLALRTTATRDAFEAIVQKTGSPVFLDLNLRDPWWDIPLIENLLQAANWVKLNDEELCVASRQPVSGGPELITYAQTLFKACQLERLIVTRGEQGAFVLSKAGLVEGEPVAVKNIVDTVGAGDAFSAVTIAGILQHQPITETLNKALSFAALICQQQGATG